MKFKFLVFFSSSCSEVQAPVAVKTEEPKKKPDCYGVFCLTYDLIAVSVFLCDYEVLS